MKGSSKSPAVSASPAVDYKGQWKKFKGWQAEDQAWYDKTMSSTKARLSAAGTKRGSSAYNLAMSDIEKQYKEKTDKLHQGATFKSLREGISATVPTWRYQVGGGLAGNLISASDYINESLGKPKGTDIDLGKVPGTNTGSWGIGALTQKARAMSDARVAEAKRNSSVDADVIKYYADKYDVAESDVGVRSPISPSSGSGGSDGSDRRGRGAWGTTNEGFNPWLAAGAGAGA